MTPLSNNLKKHVNGVHEKINNYNVSNAPSSSQTQAILRATFRVFMKRSKAMYVKSVDRPFLLKVTW